MRMDTHMDAAKPPKVCENGPKIPDLSAVALALLLMVNSLPPRTHTFPKSPFRELSGHTLPPLEKNTSPRKSQCPVTNTKQHTIPKSQPRAQCKAAKFSMPIETVVSKPCSALLLCFVLGLPMFRPFFFLASASRIPHTEVL